MKTYKYTIVLWLLMAIPILQSFLSKFQFSNYIPFFKNIDELALLLLARIAYVGFQRIQTNRDWQPIFFYFTGYITLGLISAVLNNVLFLQLVVQLTISLKIIYIICVIVGLNDACSLLQNYIKLGKFILVSSLFLVIWQFIAPSLYDSVFSNGLHRGSMLFSAGERLSRGAGVFTHPGQLAVFAASFTITLFFIHFSHNTNMVKHIRFWLIFSLTILLLTFSRLEIAATIIAISFTLLVTVKGKNRIIKYYVGIISIGGIFSLSFPLLSFYYQQYSNVGGFSSSADPRTVFFFKSIQIANDYFPLGSGLGTYGGFVAASYHSPVYLAYGFQQFYWYRAGHFLADTFWPHILGETGYIGILFYALTLATILKLALRYQKQSNNFVNLGKIIIALTFFISLNSWATPDMVSALSLSQCFLPLGCLFSISKLEYKLC